MPKHPRASESTGNHTFRTEKTAAKTLRQSVNNKVFLTDIGGYRKLKSFQLAQLCFDITVRVVELYIPPKSRPTDQMVQAVRSGVQNIAEGSVASVTNKRTELKLTNVARASIVELHLDYEDFLRQHSCQ